MTTILNTDLVKLSDPKRYAVKQTVRGLAVDDRGPGGLCYMLVEINPAEKTIGTVGKTALTTPPDKILAARKLQFDNWQADKFRVYRELSLESLWVAGLKPVKFVEGMTITYWVEEHEPTLSEILANVGHGCYAPLERDHVLSRVRCAKTGAPIAPPEAKGY